MSRRFFGTDGIRGVANKDLTPELAFSLGQAAGRWMIEEGKTPRAVLGRDTRQSGPMLGAALGAGLCSVGVDAISLGVAPTPAIAFVARTGDYGMGVVVSASHNPAPDNGIKLIGHDGCKLPDDVEATIETLMSPPESRPTGAGVGKLEVDRQELEGYFDFLVGLVPERLDGFRVVMDCAHGAAYEVAPRVFRALGAEIIPVGVEPDGMNINVEGGATKPAAIQALTLDLGVDIGVAFDGDADRVVFSDEKGSLLNGDRTIGIWSGHWTGTERMRTPIVVGTVMSNGGFEAYLADRGIELKRAPVGDKHVSRQLREFDAQIGGEQSGHIIFPELGPTGDGLATALEVLRVFRREKRPASSFGADYAPWPQLLVNLRIAQREGWDRNEAVANQMARAEAALNGVGRLNIRPSGTQPILRIMVEASDEELRDEVANSLLDTFDRELGGEVYSRVDLTHALGD